VVHFDFVDRRLDSLDLDSLELAVDEICCELGGVLGCVMIVVGVDCEEDVVVAVEQLVGYEVWYCFDLGCE